jgi:hypothetical protein
MKAPLFQAGKEDMLRMARTILACRDPKMADVTDDALWTLIEALRQVAVGENKYLRLTDDWDDPTAVHHMIFDNFQEFIAEWDAAFAAQR